MLWSCYDTIFIFQAQRTPNTIHEEHVPVARTMTYKDPEGNEDNDC